METMNELTVYVQEKAKAYLEENGEVIEKFPLSIVDFVIEHVSSGCHFPSHFTEANIVSDLSKGKTTLAMACIDVYSKVGAEGQVTHSENGISRTYDSAWISPKVHRNFPNYATII
ncbi:MAG: hypothetical protein J6Q48_10585 [Bacteroidaceae bacterium]|nr:hypothetical protein [Bacteroidaceae bacterium]